MKAGTPGLAVRALALALLAGAVAASPVAARVFTGTKKANRGDVWTATGLLSCTSDGFVRVTIGTQTVDVPVSCTG